MTLCLRLSHWEVVWLVHKTLLAGGTIHSLWRQLYAELKIGVL